MVLKKKMKKNSPPNRFVPPGIVFLVGVVVLARVVILVRAGQEGSHVEAAQRILLLRGAAEDRVQGRLALLRLELGLHLGVHYTRHIF